MLVSAPQAVSLQHVEVEKEQRGRATTGVDLQQVRSELDTICPHTPCFESDVMLSHLCSDCIVVANQGMVMCPSVLLLWHNMPWS